MDHASDSTDYNGYRVWMTPEHPCSNNCLISSISLSLRKNSSFGPEKKTTANQSKSVVCSTTLQISSQSPKIIYWV